MPEPKLLVSVNTGDQCEWQLIIRLDYVPKQVMETIPTNQTSEKPEHFMFVSIRVRFVANFDAV